MTRSIPLHRPRMPPPTGIAGEPVLIAATVSAQPRPLFSFARSCLVALAVAVILALVLHAFGVLILVAWP